MIGNAILALIAGIILVIVPSLMINAFGITLNDSTRLLGEFYGSGLILMGLVAWSARNMTDRKSQRGIFAAFTIANLVSLVLSIIDLVNHTFNALGWIAVVAYAILFVAYGGYLLIRASQAGQMQPQQQVQQTQHQPS